MNGLESKCLVQITRGELLFLKQTLDSMREVLLVDEVDQEILDDYGSSLDIIDSLLYKNEYTKEDVLGD